MSHCADRDCRDPHCDLSRLRAETEKYREALEVIHRLCVNDGIYLGERIYCIQRHAKEALEK